MTYKKKEVFYKNSFNWLKLVFKFFLFFFFFRRLNFKTVFSQLKGHFQYVLLLKKFPQLLHTIIGKCEIFYNLAQKPMKLGLN